MKRLLLIVFILAYAISASASHLVGGVIYYECIGGNQYKIIVVRYRDPTGVALPATTEVRVDPLNTSTGNLNLYANRIVINTLTPEPVNPCHVPTPNYEIEEHIYETGVFNLGPNNGGYDIYNMTNNFTAVGDQARSPAIDNIVTPGSVGQTLHSRIPDPGTYPCNSSPQFVNFPPMELCLGEPINYDYTAQDPDGDNIVYSLCAALDDGSYTPGTFPPHPVVPYSAGYSATNPLNANPPLAIDPNTGLLTGTPNTMGEYVVTVCMEEWRSGVLIGQYRREIQLKVTTCNQSITPEIGTDIPPGGVGGGNPSLGAVLSCDDYTIDFENETTNGTSQTEYYWDFGIQGSTNDTSTSFEPTFTYPDTGKYLVTLITNAGYPCADTAQAYALVYPYVEAGFEMVGPFCKGEPITLIDTSSTDVGQIVSWTWQLGNGTALQGKNPPPPVYNSTGVKNLRLDIVTSKGCTDYELKIFTVHPKPVLSVDSVNNCEGDSVQLDISTNGSDYQWTPSTNMDCDTCEDPTVWPTNFATNYSVTVTNSFGCETTDVVQVRTFPYPTVDAGPTKFYCDQAVQLEGSTSGGIGLPVIKWEPPSGLNPANGSLTPTAAPGQTTVYTLSVTKSGCESTDTVRVETNDIVVSSEPDEYNICLGESTTLNGTASKPNVTFQWYPANGVSDPNSANPTVSPMQTTVYTFEVTDLSNGCLANDTVIVRVDTPQGISAGVDTTICENESVTLNATAGNSYVWSGPSLSCTNCASPVATPSSTATYTLMGLDANGCENYDSVTVNIEPLPNLAVNNDTAICANSSLQLEATGGNMFIWAPAGSMSCDTCANPVASPSGNTTYTVKAYTTFGCESLATVTIDTIGLPNITTSSVNTICEGESVQLAASGGITYSWSPSASLNNPNIQNPLATPTLSTTYTVTGYDVNGCSNTAEVYVKVNSLQAGTFISDTGICENQTIELYANGFTTYDWSPASSLSCTNCPKPIASPASTTTYSVAVEDDNGCADTGTVTITVNPLPNAVASAQKDTICFASSTTLNGQGGVSYKWTPAIGLNNPNLQSPLASPPSSTVYTVEVTDVNGCKDVASVSLEVIPRPNTLVEPDQEICLNDTTMITASGADTYLWNGAGIISCQDCGTVEVAPTSTTTYTVTGYLANGCTKTAEHTVTVNPLPSNTSISADTNICKNDQAFLSVSGGSTYNWSPAADLSCTNCSAPVATPSATTVYTVEIINNYGCSVEETTEVIVSSPATVEVTPDTAVCPGGSIQLSAMGGVTYKWSPAGEMNDPASATPVLTPSAERTYVVEIKDALGCDIVDSVFVGIYIPADPMASDDTLICIGSEAQLSAQNGISYDWEPKSGISGANSSSPVASPIETTVYTVNITDVNGCENSDEVRVTVQPLPNVVLSGDQTVYENSSVTIVASGARDYYWNPTADIIDSSQNSIVVYPKETTEFHVLGIDQYGCENTASTLVEILERPKVYIPNAFTPNQDGKNDVFIVKHNSNFELKKLRIFNRWGNLVFETTDPDIGWDGRANGEVQPPGVYVYQLIATDKLGKTIRKNGNVTLLR